jgi:hypothetical protein
MCEMGPGKAETSSVRLNDQDFRRSGHRHMIMTEYVITVCLTCWQFLVAEATIFNCDLAEVTSIKIVVVSGVKCGCFNKLKFNTCDWY